MSYADDVNITDASPIERYLAIPVPNSAAARENALGAWFTLADGWRYGAEDESALSQWHENNQADFIESLGGNEAALQAEIDALEAQIVTLTAEIAALNAPKSITIYNYNATNRYGKVCFWANHVGTAEIIRIGDTAAIETGLYLYGDRLEANGAAILMGLSGWHYWQFKKSSGSLTAWINGGMAAGSTIAPAAMTAVLQLGGISTITTSFDTSVVNPPPTRET